jgi:hypothetical protein
MSVALTAVTEHSHFFAFKKTKIRIPIVINLHGLSPLTCEVSNMPVGRR